MKHRQLYGRHYIAIDIKSEMGFDWIVEPVLWHSTFASQHMFRELQLIRLNASCLLNKSFNRFEASSLGKTTTVYNAPGF
jgi:hypothetical protein